MALASCKECKKEVSKSAKTCPHCGVKNPGVTSKDYIAGIVALAIIIFAVSQCSTDKKAETGSDAKIKKEFEIVVPVSGSDEVKKLVADNVKKLKDVCPGLDKYASALVFDGVQDNFQFAPEGAQRAEIKILIKDDAGTIPNEYMAAGHRCFFGISRDGKKALITKQACQSVCLDRDMAGSDVGPLVISLK